MTLSYVLLLLACSGVVTSEATVYNTTAGRDPSKLNIHLVPHTHDDSGWLKTFEQYYWGTRQDIQLAAVQHILSSVVRALLDNPDRKFSYAEMSFFSLWWRHQSPAVQEQVQQLVARGQLNFINGGFVQHDEAAAHYVAMIDQTTRGHRFLNRTFGVTPKVAWQIDPFGHSATQASLMSAAAGYEALFFGRADYQDMALRRSKQQMELLWRPSVSWGASGQIWTHNYLSGNYGPPEGFNFDYGLWDQPIVDDPASPEYNVPDRVEAFVHQARKWSEVTQGNDVLFMMGSDFQYVNADWNFNQMDRLIHYVNADGRVNVLYSTPDDYVLAKASYTNVSWPVKTDDFFPYADCDHCYWTGYFTSRPTSKGYIRQATAYLAAARQLQALVSLESTPTAAATASHDVIVSYSDKQQGSIDAKSKHLFGRSALKQQQHQQWKQSATAIGSSSEQQQQKSYSLDALEFAVSLTQHHDAITGTEKQAVANDYARYLYLGMQQATDLVNAALLQLLNSAAAAASAGGSSSSSAATAASNTWFTWVQHLCDELCRLLSNYWPALQQKSSRSSSSSALDDDIMHTGIRCTSHNSSAPAGSIQVTQLHQCPLLNISICAASVSAAHQAQVALLLNGSSSSSMDGHVSASAAGAAVSSSGLLVLVYNSLGWPRRELVTVPVVKGHYVVEDADGNEVSSQLLPVSKHTKHLQQQLAAAGLLGAAAEDIATHQLVFVADAIPPVGYTTYAVRAVNSTGDSSSSSSSSSSSDAVASSVEVTESPQQQLQQRRRQRVLSNGILDITLDESTGRFIRISAADDSWSMQLTQEMMWYESSNGDEDDRSAAAGSNSGSSSRGSSRGSSSRGSSSRGRGRGSNGGSGQSSGAYIFRPDADDPVAQPLVAHDDIVKVTVTQGPVITEITQTWTSWASLTTRLVAGSGLLHQEWTVGPIPVDDDVGKEVIVRTSTDLQNGGRLFTDSNGRDMLMRRLNHRPTWKLNVTEPVAGNYYPITSAAGITDECLLLAAATDRAQGAASLKDGQLEIMLHRVTVVDDARGVGEPLNETICGTAAATGGTCTAGGLPARGRHTYIIGPGQGLAKSVRQAALQLNDPVILAFGQLGVTSSGGEVSPEVPENLLCSGTGSHQRGVAKAGTRSDTGVTHGESSGDGTRGTAAAAASSSGGVIPSLGIRCKWSGLQQGLSTPAATAAADSSGTKQTTAAAAGVLPPNVHLLTLMQADEGASDKLVLRLAHTLQVGEHGELSVPARVDLSRLINLGSNRHISSITELSLTAARYKADMKPPRAWTAGDEIYNSDTAAAAAAVVSSQPPQRQLLMQQQQPQHMQKTADQDKKVASLLEDSSAASGSSRVHGWGGAYWHSNCLHTSSSSGGGSAGSSSCSSTSSSSKAGQQTYNIWDHSEDQSPVVQLYPMEIRTWEIIIATSS